MKHFLLVFDSTIMELCSTTEFVDHLEAMDAFEAAERELGFPRYIVTLLSSDSIETLKVTHSVFFGGPDLEAMAKRMGVPLGG